MPVIDDIVNGIMTWVNQNFALILIGFAILFIVLWWISKHGDNQPKYKPVILEKEIHKYLKDEFKLTKESIGYGKTLYIGSRNAGFVLKSIFINQYPTWEETMNVNKLIKKYPETKQIIDKYNEKDNKIVNILHGFEVCGRGRINRLLANLIGRGIEIYLIDQPLIEINESSININAYSKPVKEFGIWVFSQYGIEELEEIAYKIKHEQHLESMVNIIPKSIFLGDLNAGKEKATYDMLEEINKEHRKEQLEQIKKA